ncbi:MULTISPECIES: LysR substrate-binding domain-containing protein [unclassified Pseudomonas]|uniref:LysR substrate-binding domain-containing protein n=1 Tax=unclassified Pseudomonas TaxID=196821 RepID=UPI0025E35E7E|nr:MULTISPECIES: LysR substrate-binding domain-containing protein [unclassified Pseudomonas]
MKRLPPLSALHTFLITARCCNFTRAAQTLHITQGAVSRQISGLESHLGHRLFYREARGLSLTPQGRELFPRIEQVFGLIEEAVEQLETGQQTLQLKAPTCITRWLLPRLLQWQKERPDVPVELTTTIAHEVDFRRERFDAAVVYGGHPEGSHEVHRLFDEQLTPVCAPSLLGGSQTLERPSDLEQHMLLHPTLDEQDWAHWLRAAGTRLSNMGKGQHFDTMDLAMTVASQGSGMAMGDWSLIGEDLSAGRLITPFDLRVKTGAAYYFVYPDRATSTPQVRELLDWLLAQAATRNL